MLDAVTEPTDVLESGSKPPVWTARRRAGVALAAVLVVVGIGIVVKGQARPAPRPPPTAATFDLVNDSAELENGGSPGSYRLSYQLTNRGDRRIEVRAARLEQAGVSAVPHFLPLVIVSGFSADLDFDATVSCSAARDSPPRSTLTVAVGTEGMPRSTVLSLPQRRNVDLAATVCRPGAPSPR